MMVEVSADIEGLDETVEKLVQVSRDVAGNPMIAGMRKATLLVSGEAKKLTPVDRGALRASITPEVVVREKVIEGIVGSNKIYAPPQELGTRPFWPPWTPIYEWAKRKVGDAKTAGALAAGVRLAIAARGIRAKRFLRGALENKEKAIIRILGNVVAKIVSK
jgi:HK97 gp10 family phage protein